MASVYEGMTGTELAAEIARLEEQVAQTKARHLSLDMARGKPSPEQTALSHPMLDLLTSSSDLTDDGSLVDNYGDPWGIPSARRLAGEILSRDPDDVIVCGSSSLNLMYDLVCNAYVHGIAGCEPWGRQGEVKFLCPVPGYDRHFTVTQSFGITNVPVPMGPDGPDMAVVRELVEGDASVKGIWCVPKYANPTGVTYSDDVVRAFAALRPAARDFRIFWDNAYCVHDFTDEPARLLDIFEALAQAGADDLVYEFASTAKVTFPSSGMAFLTASKADLAEVKKAFSAMRVSPEKVSQLAHARFLRDAEGVRAHMRRHAAIVRPRFELVERKLTEGLGGLGVARWTHPTGGYFVSFDGPEGSAKAIVALAAEMGVKLTPAGAAFPYGNDPADTNIRIAPTFPSLDDLSQALDVFVLAVRLVSARLERDRRA